MSQYSPHPFSCNIDGCKENADYLAWFEGCGGLYTYYCTAHAVIAVKDGVNGFKLSCLRSIEDAIYKYRGDVPDKLEENNGQ